MKSLVELNAELDAIRQEGRSLIGTAEAEERKLTDEEQAQFDGIRARIEAKKAEIAEAEKEIEQKSKSNTNPNTMEKRKFSLVGAIRSVVDGSAMDEANAAVIAAGKAQMRAAGLNTSGAIVIPTAEARAVVSVTGTTGATVPVDVAPIFDELRAESVLARAGATFYDGLVGDLKVPMMTAAQVAWAAENAAASDAAANVQSVLLQPKRLTAYCDISKQMLVQDAGSNVEAALQANLIRAINEKFEATILGAVAGSATQPAGLFNGRTATSTTTWGAVADLEATVERANGRVRAVIASPEAKAKFRAMTYNKTTQLVYQDGYLEDVPCLSTPNVAANNYLVGDFAYLAVGTWGGIDITVDPFTQAGNGEIRLVVNVYMDAAVPAAAAGVIVAGKTVSA
jgi:HK97 family phage major capsid protein